MSEECINPQFQSPLNISSKDKFLMILDLPYVLKTKDGPWSLLSVEPLQISIYGTVVPDIAVAETDARFMGQNLYSSAYARPSYSPLSVNFIVDNDYKNYYMLWAWLDVMNLSVKNYYGGSSQLSQMDKTIIGDQFEYQTTIRVVALNEYNQPSLEFIYTKAFVTKLGGINFSYRDPSVLEASAEFRFSQLNIEKPEIARSNILPSF